MYVLAVVTESIKPDGEIWISFLLSVSSVPVGKIVLVKLWIADKGVGKSNRSEEDNKKEVNELMISYRFHE